MSSSSSFIEEIVKWNCVSGYTRFVGGVFILPARFLLALVVWVIGKLGWCFLVVFPGRVRTFHFQQLVKENEGSVLRPVWPQGTLTHALWFMFLILYKSTECWDQANLLLATLLRCSCFICHLWLQIFLILSGSYEATVGLVKDGLSLRKSPSMAVDETMETESNRKSMSSRKVIDVPSWH